MEVYVSRQPIFDRGMNIYGYQLLYNRDDNNFMEKLDEGKVSAELINDAYYAMQFIELTNSTKAFIKFSDELIEMEIPTLLPKDRVVIEINSRGVPSVPFYNACKKLKEAGYILALDDYQPHDSFLPLTEIADIIKVDFNTVKPAIYKLLLAKYKEKFLAMNIETREQFNEAHNLGFTYFQGSFFYKPVVISGKMVEELNTSLIRILNELNRPEPEFDNIAEIIEGDLGLAYKLLKLSNTLLYGTVYTIDSIRQALIRLGLDGIKRWVYILMVKNNQIIENRELIRNCLVRAKLMELLAVERGIVARTMDFFIAGLFSSIDVLLNRDMKSITEELALSDDVKNALMGEENAIRYMLDLVLLYEGTNPGSAQDKTVKYNITSERYMELYLQSLKWMMELDY